MILGPISLFDCLVFCLLLAPQLIWHVGLVRTSGVVLRALPFLLLQLPVDLFRHWLWLPASRVPAFAREASPFEYLVTRCVRYAFKYIPPDVANTFFSKSVSLPFLRWRMLRHGIVKFPVHWHEYEDGATVRGLWIRHDPSRSPDMVIYYLHGGGFSMGSSHFYLEFLLTWAHLLVEAGFKNPAIFALDYTLVPKAVYPTQLSEVTRSYDQVLQVAGDASRVCVAGDSAGGALILGLLQEIGAQAQEPGGLGIRVNASSVKAVPRIAALISPWLKLQSDTFPVSAMDYLDQETLWEYGFAYAGEAMVNRHPASPGSCTDDELWKAAAPQRGHATASTSRRCGSTAESMPGR
ncbi:neutral cholesterol ester hydrolase 1 [Ophiocordyceps camponoti-floridani]|uniref:Neutral cholesterol ester hydrolase 1 n=1 Tax=Ophiocordyceps camponoti-floridani TaxID=2030778 RepID=A0A8H4VEW2_9HYPO|nr:neutral cholesterol ester hydrolase 1 [Ophiocordyceps camponoti-floridani]